MRIFQQPESTQFINRLYILITIWQFNIAMEHGKVIADLPLQRNMVIFRYVKLRVAVAIYSQ